MSKRHLNYEYFIHFLDELDYNIKCSDYVEYNSFNEDYDADDLMYNIETSGGFDKAIIYYSNAIRFLSEHDPSLHESLEIAEEYGYSPCNLNSEILASLLATRMNMDNYPKEEIQEFLDSLDWTNEDNDDLPID